MSKPDIIGPANVKENDKIIAYDRVYLTTGDTG